MKVKTKLEKIASFSKGAQINGDNLIQDGKYCFLNGGISPSGKWNEYNVLGNTVTISEGGNSCGYVNYMTEPFWCGAHCYFLFDTLKNSKYLYYVLKSQQNRLMKIRTGACMPNIKKADLGNFEIVYDTDIVKQNEVVSVLSNIEAIVENRKKQFCYYDNLIKARFVEMFGDVKENEFGWSKCKFGDVTTKITDGEHGTVPRVDESEGHLYFMARNITKDGNIDLKEKSFVPHDIHAKIYKRCNPEYKDLLLVCVGATIGKCTLVPKDMGEFSMARSVALLKPNKEKVTSQFLINLLRSEAIQNDINQCSPAAAKAGLYTNMIINLDAFVPPIQLQKRFDAFVSQVDKSKVAVQKSLEQTQLLFDSLMQEYFG